MDLDLAGRTALVTGSSSGIGAAIAAELAAEGARVIVHGRNVERANVVAARIWAAGGQAAVAIGDLSTNEGASGVAEQALAAFGTVDILVNNAGGSFDTPDPSFFSVTPENLVATYEPTPSRPFG